MAYFDDVEKRARELTPEVAEIMEIFDKACAEVGVKGGASVTIVEDMTDEEEEMAIFAAYLKEGCAPNIAAEKAKKFHAGVKKAFRKLDEMPRKKNRGNLK